MLNVLAGDLNIKNINLSESLLGYIAKTKYRCDGLILVLILAIFQAFLLPLLLILKSEYILNPYQVHPVLGAITAIMFMLQIKYF